MLLRWCESAKGKGGGSHPLQLTVLCTSGLFRKILQHAGCEEQVKIPSQNFLEWRISVKSGEPICRCLDCQRNRVNPC